MATIKFAGPSPYSLPVTYPEDDYLHTEFVMNTTLDKKNISDVPPLGAALFGLGRIGNIHLPTLVNNKRIALKYIVDDVSSRFEEVKKYWRFGNDVQLITSKESDKVFKDPSVKMVVVGSPTYTHEEIVVKAIAANKDVFCEKPIAEKYDEIKRCYDTAKSNGRTLLSAYNRRFDPAYSNLRERVRKGDVGHVQIVKLTARDSPLPSVEYLRTSGGIFHDCLVHDFDLACWVTGEVPIRVQASASALIPEVKAIDDFDNVGFLLTFPSGAVALGDNSRFSCYGYDQRLEVFGNKGMVKVDNERPCHSTEVVLGQEGVLLTPIYYSFDSRYKLAYIREMNHFLDVVQYGVKAAVTGIQNLIVSKIADAAEKSARTGKAIDLEWSSEFANAYMYS